MELIGRIVKKNSVHEPSVLSQLAPLCVVVDFEGGHLVWVHADELSAAAPPAHPVAERACPSERDDRRPRRHARPRPRSAPAPAAAAAVVAAVTVVVTELRDKSRAVKLRSN